MVDWSGWDGGDDGSWTATGFIPETRWYACTLSSTKAVILYTKNASDGVWGRIITRSGTSVSIGTEQTLVSGTNEDFASGVSRLSDTTFFYTSYDGTAVETYVTVGTLSGSSLTAGTAETFLASTSTTGAQVYADEDGGGGIFVYDDGVDTFNCKAFTYSGGTYSVGSETTVLDTSTELSNSINGDDACRVMSDGNNHWTFAYQYYSLDNFPTSLDSECILKDISRSSTTATVGSALALTKSDSNDIFLLPPALFHNDSSSMIYTANCYDALSSAYQPPESYVISRSGSTLSAGSKFTSASANWAPTDQNQYFDTGYGMQTLWDADAGSDTSLDWYLMTRSGTTISENSAVADDHTECVGPFMISQFNGAEDYALVVAQAIDDEEFILKILRVIEPAGFAYSQAVIIA